MKLKTLLKEPEDKWRGYYFPQILGQKGLSTDEIRKVLYVDVNTVTSSRLSREGFIDYLNNLDKTNWSLAYINNGKEKIAVESDWNFLYIKRTDSELIWGISNTFKEKGTGKFVLKYESRHNLNLKTDSGVSVINYKGLIRGREAFALNTNLTATYLQTLDHTLIPTVRE